MGWGLLEMGGCLGAKEEGTLAKKSYWAEKTEAQKLDSIIGKDGKDMKLVG